MSLIDPIYCDTDSIVFRKKDLHNLEEKGLIGKTLGKFAREYEADILQADFLAAKCYYMITNSNEEKKKRIIKFKGVKSPTL